MLILSSSQRLTLLLILFCCLTSSSARADTAKTPDGAITGTVTLPKNCNPGKIELWLSSGKTLLYQAEVPPQGTFEFHTAPGNYNLIATSSSGCFVELSYQIKEGERKNVNLALKFIPPSPKKGNK